MIRMLSGRDVDVAGNVKRVTEQIARAADRRGIDARTVKLLAVTKTVGADLVAQALKAGVTCLGENRVQEGVAKRSELAGQVFEFHLIGPLQKNKVNKAVDCFDCIETIESVELAQRINRACEALGKQMAVLVQINLAREPSKSGIAEEDLAGLVQQVRAMRYLSLRGLMAIPPPFENSEEVRPFFLRMKELLMLLNAEHPPTSALHELSMGMSHDFPVAIEEGATIVRIGAAIFGERPLP